MEVNRKTDIALTVSQQRAFDKMKDFVGSHDRVFILKGFAGTGKTTLMRFLIQELKQQNKTYKLLASTGRAAKILRDLTGDDDGASTIHSLIYQFKDLNKDMSEQKEINADSTGQLFLVFDTVNIDENQEGDTIYIIDEASMVADIEDKLITQAKFGSGRLLKELLDYDLRENSKFIFVGDPCQLPPINENNSPALSIEYFKKTFGITAQEAILTEIMRQESDNSLIAVSKEIRSLYNAAPSDKAFYGSNRVWGKIKMMRRCCKIHLSINDMVSSYINDIQENGYEDSIYICKQNKRCTEISSVVREALGYKGVIEEGDLLMVVQNNSHGLVNGDMVEVISVNNNIERRAGLYFRQVTIKELFSQNKLTLLLLESLLTSDKANLDSSQQTELFIDFAIRMKDKGITQKNKMAFQMAMQNDPYLNALRCSYGYAITCHKAQGGEWKNVYIDVPRNIVLNPIKADYQWIYTAMTRSRNTLHMVDDFYLQ